MLNGTYPPGEGHDQKMTITDLRQLNSSVVQLALHGYHHEHFKQKNRAELKEILLKSIDAFEQSGLPYHRSLAYPYGGRPKSMELEQLKTMMQEIGITSAFRIGNQVSKVPAPDIYEIRRIDICGTDTMEEFKIKLKKGKLKPF